MDARKLYSPIFHLLKRKTPKAPGNKTQPINHYKRSTPPISVPLNKLFSNAFPLSIRESISDFKTRNNLFKFQHDLLSTLPFYPYMDASGRFSQVLKVNLNEKQYINEFVIYPNEKTKINYQRANHLIMIHGYGSGLGLFLKNFNDITQDNWVIHAIDLLGYGCSSRPPFTPTNFDQVESWFHDSFQTWMKKRKIPKENTLVMAHSMGAYLTASYGIKNPDFCKKLIMVLPGGITNHKKEVSIPRYFERLWEQNISPFSLVRNASFYGSKLVSGWSFRRFAKLSENEKNLLHKYVYGIFQAPGSGEYMLNYLLKPGANPRYPMTERDLGKCDAEFKWWYGEEDWMNVAGGEKCTAKLNKVGKKSTVVEIENAGHHIYLDNPQLFNKMLINEMNEMEK